MKVSVNMWGGFPCIVQDMFPNARLIFDQFYVMQPVNEELNKVRKQTGMTVKGSKFLLLKNGVELNPEAQINLTHILKHSKRLRLACELKEEFREFFESCRTVNQGKEQFLKWLKKARPVYCEVLTTIRTHLEGICNYFFSRTTSV